MENKTMLSTMEVAMKRIVGPALVSALMMSSTVSANQHKEEKALKEIKDVIHTFVEHPSWSEVLSNISKTRQKGIDLFKNKISTQMDSIESKIFNVLCSILSTQELLTMAKLRGNNLELFQKIITALCQASINFITLIKNKTPNQVNFVVHIEGQARSLDEIEEIVTSHIKQFKKAATSYNGGFSLPGWLAGFIHKAPKVNDCDIDNLLKTVADELLSLIQTLQKQIDSSAEISSTMTEIKTAAHKVSDGLDDYKEEFSRILEEALEEHLSPQEIGTLVDFLKSSAYQKIKTRGLPKLLDVMGIAQETTDLLSSVSSLAKGTLLLFKDTIIQALKGKR